MPSIVDMPCVVCPNCLRTVPRANTRCLTSLAASWTSKSPDTPSPVHPPEENWLEPRQLRDLFDLLLEELQFIERILVFRSHDAILPYASFRLVARWASAPPPLKM